MGRLQLKARDAWWTVLVIDPIAGPLVRLIASQRWLTPNRLTLLSVLLALAAGASFAADELLAGALFYQASFLVDCMDGKLAGLRNMRSPWGDFVDQSGDSIRYLACLTGLAYGALDLGSDAAWLALVAAYPCLRFTILLLGSARPEQRPRGHVEVEPRPLAILKTAPSRLTKPGTSVDTETVAFTLGPAVGEPLAGVAVAAAMDLLHLAVLAAAGFRNAARASAPVGERSSG